MPQYSQYSIYHVHLPLWTLDFDAHKYLYQKNYGLIQQFPKIFIVRALLNLNCNILESCELLVIVILGTFMIGVILNIVQHSKSMNIDKKLGWK